MEGLVELLPLLFVAAYYLLRGRQRAAQKRERQEAPQQALISDGVEGAHERVSEPTPFQRFLQQMEEAVSEAAGEPLETDKRLEVETNPLPSPLPAPPTKPVRPTALQTASSFQAPTGSFDSSRPVDHDWHGFGDENPLSEQAFEKRPSQQPAPAGRRPVYDPHELAPQPSRLAEPADVDWRRRLRDPVTAREAFLLQTIFGPRGGRHGKGPRA